MIECFRGCYDKDGKVVFDQEEIEEGVLHHFSNRFKGKRTPIHGQNVSVQPGNVDPDVQCLINPEEGVVEDKYESDVCAPMTMTELNGILSKLPNEKSSGVDLIPNEFLKNCGNDFKSIY